MSATRKRYFVRLVGRIIVFIACLIMSFNPINLILLVVATIVFVTLAFILFNRGLKHYSSSNLMGARS